jgi:hypothetical protein
MGQAQSSQKIKNETVNKIFKTNLTEISNETSTKAKCSASSTQELDIKMGDITGCTLDLSQKAEVNVKCLQTVKSEVDNQALTKIQNDLRAAAESELDNMTSGFAVPPGGVDSRQDILNKVENTIETETENIIKNAFDNTLISDATGSQVIKIDIGDCNESTVAIDQDQIIKLVAEQATDNIIRNIAKDVTLNKLEADSKGSAKNVTKGGDAVLVDMVGGIFSGLMSMWLIIPVIVIVIIIGLVVMMSGGGESPAPPANSSSPDFAALLAKAAKKGKGGSKMKIGKKYGGKGMKAKKLKW